MGPFALKINPEALNAATHVDIYGQASGNGVVWNGVGGGGLCAERGGGRWSCSWRNGQASQTRPA